MWSTAVPLLRAASSSVLMFSTTFWAAACSGAPESFEAPSSATTSRCMSSTIKTVRAGSMAWRSGIRCSSVHAGRAVPGDGGSQRVHRGGGADEERLPLRAAPGLVADVLGGEDAAEQLAVAGEHVQAARARDPEIACLVELLAVGDARLEAEPLHLVDHVTAGQRSVGRDREAADVTTVGVVDPERLLVLGEAQAVRLLEVVDEQLQLAVGGDAVDALEVELLLTLDSEAGPAPVGRIGEDDRAVRGDDDIVGAVELLALPVRGDHGARAVGLDADQAARGVLADQQAALEIPAQPVALVGRVRDNLHAARGRPAPAGVARHVGEQERASVAVRPQRPLGERESGPDALELRIRRHKLEQSGRVDFDDTHGLGSFRLSGARPGDAPPARLDLFEDHGGVLAHALAEGVDEHLGHTGDQLRLGLGVQPTLVDLHVDDGHRLPPVAVAVVCRIYSPDPPRGRESPRPPPKAATT